MLEATLGWPSTFVEAKIIHVCDDKRRALGYDDGRNKGSPMGLKTCWELRRITMMTINVLLSGRLQLDGYGRGKPTNADGTIRLGLDDGSTIREVIKKMGVPTDRVALTMVNGRQCPVGNRVKADDRVILIPSDVAVLWRFLGRQNLDMGIGYDTGN
jgi:Mut7-C ubiquitin